MRLKHVPNSAYNFPEFNPNNLVKFHNVGPEGMSISHYLGLRRCAFCGAAKANSEELLPQKPENMDFIQKLMWKIAPKRVAVYICKDCKEQERGLSKASPSSVNGRSISKEKEKEHVQ